MLLIFPHRQTLVNSLNQFKSKQWLKAYFQNRYDKLEVSEIENKIFEETYLSLFHFESFESQLQHFESETLQVTATCNQFAINQYFESLKEILGKLKADNKEEIIHLVEKYKKETEDSNNRILKYNPESKTFNLWNLELLEMYFSDCKAYKKDFYEVAEKHIALYENGKYQSTSSVTIINPQFLASTYLNNETSEAESEIKKLKWSLSPKEFVELFAPLITKRKIFLNKSTEPDTEPIVKLLHSFFEIKKEKGTGEISLSSLSTYFKNYNSENAKKK